MALTHPIFSVPTRVVSGLGSRHQLADAVAALGGKRVVLVGDRGLSKIGVLEPFEELLRAAPDIELVRTALADVDPSIASAEQLAAELVGENIDVIIGIGGGSALSVAKGAALAIRNPDPLLTYAAGVGLAPNAAIPTIAIPTTAGSGAEVSSTFVLYDTANVRSIGFVGRGYEPDIALLDGDLLVGLPVVPMRDAALDAFSHAFEALWGRRRTSFSTLAGFEAIRLIRELLPRAISDRDPEDLHSLLEASALANIACGNAGLGLVHAMTGASVIHIAHGRQNGVVLPHVAEFNSPLLSDEARAEIDTIHGFYEEVGAPLRFDATELPDGAAAAMVAAALTSPLRPNNIRETSEDDLYRIATAATTPA